MSHFYDKDGNPVFEVPNISKGGMRPTNIKDARKLKLLTSVSTYFEAIAKKSLEDYKNRQITMAAFMTQPRPMETPEAYHTRIMEAADKDRDSAADLGTRIHKAIEDYMQGKPYDTTLDVYVQAVAKWMKENSIIVKAQELRLVNLEDGYAGTTDLEFEQNGKVGIGDFKSRRTKPDEVIKSYDSQPAQIAAYFKARFKRTTDMFGFNLFISTTEPGRVDPVWYSHDELYEAWEYFQHVMAIYRYSNNYDPRQT